ncbi:hypothetical protein FPV60_00715 [Acinetobacter colistiniresistens]|uniref:Uncharacterized protein n=1 Tax=Acinetobacter colistiniresistens TaxID=280145 RepID=A0A558FQD3_9GAMM|nr:hypothetical protein FPV60_00715 [Acinetobacter colistiniresistens]
MVLCNSCRKVLHYV